MTEDRDFNAFIKMKLEEGLEVPAPAAVARTGVLPRLGGRRSALLAASLAAAVGVAVWMMRFDGGAHGEGPDGEPSAELLADGDWEDGFQLEEGDFADRLLAWQDAPYEQLL